MLQWQIRTALGTKLYEEVVIEGSRCRGKSTSWKLLPEAIGLQ